MISIQDAKNKVNKEFPSSDYNVEVIGTGGSAFVFLCRNKDEDATPDTMIVAVNKATMKMGYSVYDVNAAIKASM